MASAAPQQQLGQIAALARSGRLDEAAVMATSAFAASPRDPVLAALAGAVECRRGQFGRAIPYLEVAHRLRPQDLTIRVNLAEAFFHAARAADALRLCDEASASADPTLRLARLGGHLAQEAEDHVRAVRLYRVVVAKDQQDWASWNNLGNALTGAGEHVEAVNVLRRAMKLAPDAPPIRVNLGKALMEAGRFEEAEKTFRDAARDFPDDSKPLVALANLFRSAGLDEMALEALGEAARRAPDDAAILSDHGQEAARLNEYAVAERSYEAALTLLPSMGPPVVGLAALYERTNRESELDSLRERAMTSKVDEQSIAYIDALRLKRAEQFEEALAALERAGEAVIPHRRYQLRGIMLDRLGRYDEAFDEFSAMNADRLADPSQPAQRGKAYHDHVAQGFTRLTSPWLSGWTAPDGPQDRPSPVFLLGFPRSGTTLLDTMLMSAPGTLVLEEEPFVVEAEQDFGGMEALSGLDSATITQARATYFEKVTSRGKLDPNTLVVDKHPLHLNNVPVIHRLFPDAKFILALRHPCDVLLSCFITNFRTNHAMSNFLELETAAQLYDLSFSYWTKARELFDLPVHTIAYERLVADQSRELAPLFDWLGLPWQSEGFDHRKAARARGVVRTASYAQVTEPVYTRAAGRWHRYGKHLEPVFDRVRPWVERFGYSLDDDRIPAWDEPSA